MLFRLLDVPLRQPVVWTDVVDKSVCVRDKKKSHPLLSSRTDRPFFFLFSSLAVSVTVRWRGFIISLCSVRALYCGDDLSVFIANFKHCTFPQSLEVEYQFPSFPISPYTPYSVVQFYYFIVLYAIRRYPIIYWYCCCNTFCLEVHWTLLFGHNDV